MPADSHFSNTEDLNPTNVNVYGYCITYKKSDQWIVDQCDEYRNLPAHYPFFLEALDRAAFLRKKGVACRVVALLAENTDTAEDFKNNRMSGERDE